MRTRSRKPEYQIKIAKERIGILFELAEKELKRHPERGKRYVELARKIGMRYNVRLGDYKGKFCKNCNSILKPGFSSEQRIEKGTIIIKCLKCNKIYRRMFKR